MPECVFYTFPPPSWGKHVHYFFVITEYFSLGAVNFLTPPLSKSSWSDVFHKISILHLRHGPTFSMIFFCLFVLFPHFVSLSTFLHCYYSHLIFQAQVSVAMTLASMRYDSLFDYGTSLPDTKGGEVVQKYYKYLHTSVKSILQRRNAERFERGYLPYPYLVPGWIANSVHT